MCKHTKTTPEDEVITLKWGTLKGWNVSDDNKMAHELLERYHKIGSCMSAACQKDTPEQKQILCDLISLPNMKVYLSWDGEYTTREKGIDYIMGYGKKEVA